MTIPTIKSVHLTLRPWNIADAQVLHEILHEENILQYFPNPLPPTRDKVEKYIIHQLAHWEEHGYGHWAVTLKESGQVIGWNGLEHLPELDETEIAYLLSKKAWGQGYATEAAQIALQFGFEQAGLKAIIGLVHPGNLGSVRVLEKCGLLFVDRITLWGLGMSRYRIPRKTATRQEYQDPGK